MAIYTRLSNDPTGEQTATHRQEHACRALAEARDWTVVEVFTDVDLSAYQRSVVRPSYERLIEAISGRSIDAVLVWKLDRLVRGAADFERIWDLCDANRVHLLSVTEPIDTSTDLGLAMVRIMVNFASLESATMSLRAKGKCRENAVAGRPPGGPPPFGYTAGYCSTVAHEADLIRAAADRLVAGESLSAIVASWQRRGIRARSGGPMLTTSLRVILASPRLVGDRVQLGQVVARGCLPAILDRETGTKVRAILADPSRRRNVPSARYLLTGLLRCGRCGMPMHGRVRHRRPTYGCPLPTKGGGCGRVWVTGVALDHHVTATVIEHAATREVGEADIPGDDRLGADLEDLAAQVAALYSAYSVERTIARSE